MILAAIVALAVVVPSLSGLGDAHLASGPTSGITHYIGATSGSLDPRGGSLASTGQPRPSAMPPAARVGAANPGKIGETYDFQNNSLIPGNYTNISNIVGPTTAAADSSNGRIYVGGFSGFVGVVDAVNSTLAGAAPVFAGANAIAIGATSATVYVADSFDSNVTVLDTRTMSTVTSFSVGSNPSALQYDPQNGELYVALANARNVSVVDPTSDAVIRTIPTSGAPTALTIDATSHRLFVSSFNSGNLTVINTSNDQVVTSLPVGYQPAALTFASQSGQVFVADFGTNNLTVVNATSDSVVTTVPLAFAPNTVTYDPAVGFVYAASESSNLIEVVNVRTDGVVGSLSAIAGPSALLYDSVTGDVYVAEFASDNLTVINPGSNGIIGSIRLGLEPDAVAYDLKTGAIGTAMLDAGVLELINGTTGAPIATFPVGLQPTAVQYDVVNECFYVAGTGSNVVTVINGTTLRIVSIIPVTQPINFAFVQAYDYVYVLSGHGTYVGSYPTTVSVINGASNQVVGTIHVTGVNGIGGLAFDPTNGDLYVGTGSNVTVVGALNHSVVATIPLSGVSFSIAADPLTGTVFVGCLFVPPGFGFDSNLTVINGTSNTISALVPLDSPAYAMDYDAANGLLYLSQFSGLGNLTAFDPKTNVVVGTVGSFLYPDGLADTGPTGQVLSADAYTSSLAIVTLSGLGHYAVNFTERGLSAGQTWSVVANGGTYSSSTASIVVTEPDGSVSFSVNPVLGYTASPVSSSVTVDGAFVAVAILFTPLPPTYGVNFVETGLPSGSNWSVTLAGVSQNSTQTTITFHVANGSLLFAVGSITGFVRSPTSGTVHVLGKDLLLNVTFTPVATGTTTPGGSAPSGLSALLGFGAAGAGAAVGAAVGVVVALARRGRAGGPPPSDPAAPATE